MAMMYHAQDKIINMPLAPSHGPARRHSQQPDTDHHEADSHDRWLCAFGLRLSTIMERSGPTGTRWSWCGSSIVSHGTPIPLRPSSRAM